MHVPLRQQRTLRGDIVLSRSGKEDFLRLSRRPEFSVLEQPAKAAQTDPACDDVLVIMSIMNLYSAFAKRLMCWIR